MCLGILQQTKGRTMKEQVPVGCVENVFMSKNVSLTDLRWAKPRMCQKPRNASGISWSYIEIAAKWTVSFASCIMGRGHGSWFDW